MWVQGLAALVGIWLMAAPAVLGFDGAAATNARVVGPFIGAFAITAMGQCTRNVRLWNLPLAAWLIAAPVFLDHAPAAAVNSVGAGVAVGALSLVRGHMTNRYAGGWAVLWRGSAGATDGAVTGE